MRWHFATSERGLDNPVYYAAHRNVFPNCFGAATFSGHEASPDNFIMLIRPSAQVNFEKCSLLPPLPLYTCTTLLQISLTHQTSQSNDMATKWSVQTLFRVAQGLELTATCGINIKKKDIMS